MNSKLGKKVAPKQSVLKKSIKLGIPLAGLFAALPLAGMGENASATAVDGDTAMPPKRSGANAVRGEMPVTGEPILVLPQATTVYVVKSGDTLSKIAVKYNTSVEKLKELNQLSGNQADKLQHGQKLIVPTPANRKNESALQPTVGRTMSPPKRK
ncbi:MAG: LysM peptidoglycan-binding domain-containing protein [Victivallaceae bacterium]|nr:LysM peptidoglycan-binding domain-containing protein [Victivallaceae bacterium]